MAEDPSVPLQPGDESDAAGRLHELIGQSDFRGERLEDTSGYRLLFGSEHDPIDVVLLPGVASIWLLVPFELEEHGDSRLRSLELVNELNKDVPFGVFYLDSDRLVYRNAIRLRTLSSAAELKNFVLTSLAAIKQLASKIGSRSGARLSSFE